MSRVLVPLFAPSAERVLSPTGASEASKLRREQLALVKEHQEWMQEAIDAELRPAVLAQKEAKHTEKLTELKERIAELEADNVFAGITWIDHARNIMEFEPIAWEHWNALSLERQRVLIQALYTSVKVMPQGVGTGTAFKPELIKTEISPLLQELEEVAMEWLLIASFR